MKSTLGFSAILATLALAGCGNDQSFKDDFVAIKDSMKLAVSARRQSGSPQQAHLSAEMIGSVLVGHSRPVTAVTIEDRNSTGFFTLIESNGAYGTYGSADRQALVFKRGVLTGTRGLGADLMSSSSDSSIALISARRSGNGTRVHRYIDGGEETVEIRFSCSVSVGESKSIAFGTVRGTGRVVREVCGSDGQQITNTYVVDGGSRVLWSRQWIGPSHGYAAIAPVRL